MTSLCQINSITAPQPLQILIEGIYMLALSKQRKFAAPVTVTDSEIDEFLRTERAMLPSFANQLANKQEEIFVIIARALHPLTEHVIHLHSAQPSSHYERILSFSAKCIQLMYSRTQESAGEMISIHSFFISPLLPYLLDPKISLPLRYLAGKLISSSLTSLTISKNIPNVNSTDNEPTEEEIEELVNSIEQRNQFQRSQYLSGLLLTQIFQENGTNKKLLSTFSTTEEATPSTIRFLSQISRTIGEMASTFVYYNKEKWDYFYGRFGSYSKWLQPSEPPHHREIPARIFANAIIFYHKLVEATGCLTIPSQASRVNMGLDEIEIIKLWIFLMLEPNYSTLQGLFTHALIRKFAALHSQSTLVEGLFPGEIFLPLCVNHQETFNQRKKIFYVFLDQIVKCFITQDAIPSTENIKLFYNWFHSVPRRLNFALSKELPAKLIHQGTQVLVEHTQFTYSIMGRLLSHCTFLLYRPKSPSCIFPVIISTFFKTSTMDLSYRLQYLPILIDAFGKLSELFSIDSDPCLQREFKELFEFYWETLLKSPVDQKRLIRAWCISFASNNFTKLRRFFLLEVLCKKLNLGGESLTLALKLITQILYSPQDNFMLLEDISLVGLQLLSILGNGITLANRISFYSFWLRMLSKIQNNQLENQGNSLFVQIADLFILLLFDDLFRLLSSNIQVEVDNSTLSALFIRKQKELTHIHGTSLKLQRVLSCYPTHQGMHVPSSSGIMERIFLCLEKSFTCISSGRRFIQQHFDIFHEMFDFLCSYQAQSKATQMRNRYLKLLHSFGNFGSSYILSLHAATAQHSFVGTLPIL